MKLEEAVRQREKLEKEVTAVLEKVEMARADAI